MHRHILEDLYMRETLLRRVLVYVLALGYSGHHSVTPSDSMSLDAARGIAQDIGIFTLTLSYLGRITIVAV
jgi:hypothetical protein